jgi:hypothetical protein
VQTLIELQSEQLTNEYSAVHAKREWDVNSMAYGGASAQDLRAAISASTDRSMADATDDRFKASLAEDDVRLMRTGAYAYAKQGKFADSKVMIAALGMHEQAAAYEMCLRLAKSPLDLERLRPDTDKDVMVYDPDITMMFEANEARLSGNLDAMGAQVERLAGMVAEAGADDAEGHLPDPTMCRTQAASLLVQMKTMQPGSQLPATRVLVSSMRQSATFGADLSTMSYTYTDLMESGVRADHELVFETIQGMNAASSKKAEQLSRLALTISERM